MVVTSRGGSRDTIDGTTCDPIWLDYQDALPNETTTGLERADGETTWSFEVDGLAPEQWSLALVAPSSTTVTEGQDFMVHYAPVTTGVAIQGVYIDRMGVTAVTTSSRSSARCSSCHAITAGAGLAGFGMFRPAEPRTPR